MTTNTQEIKNIPVVPQTRKEKIEFMFGIGIAIGMLLGFALGALVIYHQAQDWASSAAYNYTMQLPPGCRPREYNYTFTYPVEELLYHEEATMNDFKAINNSN
jgi:hypothetical protein